MEADQGADTDQSDVEADQMDIVAIAASAGGLEAMSLLAQNLPTSINCAYVLAQHMSPSHKSMLVMLLSRETALAVEELDGPIAPQPNTIYIPPPGFDAIYEDGRLALRRPMGHPASPKPSADRLFKSLAAEKGEHTIGVVLSGTGSDGSLGVQAIREAGGITIAQTPESCKYEAMPYSAQQTGCVDLTLPPQQIGQHLETILKRPRDLSDFLLSPEMKQSNADLFQIIQAHKMVDFRLYKESTINRRVNRRMIAKGIEDFDTYVELCRKSVAEVDALYRDLLISVTRFFRDPDQFDALRKHISKHLDSAQPNETLRIWVPGCATGEEAYTIGILAIEALGGLDNITEGALQIFATDLDEDALVVARAGTYPASIVADVPEVYLEKYFTFSDDTVKVTPRLKHHIVFSRHNVFQDAPFISLDLVSIRNVLIYFSAALQDRVLTRIQYALKPDGLLLLGASESIGAHDDLFIPLEANARIFRKRQNRMARRLSRSLASPQGEERMSRQLPLKPDPQVESWARFDLLARAVVKNGLVTNRDRSILKIYGDIAPFTQMTAPIDGGLTLNVLRQPLGFEATSITLVAFKQKEMRFGQWHELSGRDFDLVRMVAYPLPGLEEHEEDLVLIGFTTERRETTAPESREGSDYIAHLETELLRSRETLHATIEQLQTSNEELQSVNEELQSANEELQSTNEELETTNEEFQSTNEELITVNEELLINTSQLERTSAELRGLIRALPAKALMLDQGLLIRHASDMAIEQFEIQDRGQTYGHLSQISLPEGYPQLTEICTQAMIDRKPRRFAFELQSASKLLSVVPLLSNDDRLIGLIVLDTGEETSVRPVLEVLSQFADVGSWEFDVETKATRWSSETARIFGASDDGTERALDTVLGHYHPADRAMVEGHLLGAAQDGEIFQYAARLQQPDGGLIVVDAAGYAIADKTGNVTSVVGFIRDRSHADLERFLTLHQLNTSQDSHLGFFCYDLEFGVPVWSQGLYQIMGLGGGDRLAQADILDRIPADIRNRIQAKMDAAVADLAPFRFAEPLELEDGETLICRGRGEVGRNVAGKPTHIYGAFQFAEPPALGRRGAVKTNTTSS
ncbi:MAG: chemotaxis protein CheB [Pseudomonadota bacterium]